MCIGLIIRLQVPDKATGLAKGSAFVFVSGKKNAERLILLLHDCVACPDAPQRMMRVDYATGERERMAMLEATFKLFIGNLPPDFTVETLQEMFAGRDAQEFIPIKNKPGMPNLKGSAFVKMGSRRAAQQAILELDNKYTVPSTQFTVNIKFADTKPVAAPPVGFPQGGAYPPPSMYGGGYPPPHAAHQPHAFMQQQQQQQQQHADPQTAAYAQYMQQVTCDV